MAFKFRRGIFVTLSFLIVTVCICVWQFWPGPKEKELILYGNVDIRQVDLAFRVGGRLTDVLVEEGDKVEVGQPLARIEKDILEQQLAAAKAELQIQQANLLRLEKGYRIQEIAQARAAVASAEAQAENAKIAWKRITRLRSGNAASQKDLDNAAAVKKETGAALRSAREHLAMLMAGFREEDVLAQKASVESAQAQFNKAAIQLADAVLYAPQKGIILTRAREAGAIVSEGQTIYTLTLNDPVWIRAYVDEPSLGLIYPGMEVEVETDSVPGKKYPGTIGFISPLAEFTPKTVETMEVRTSLVYRIRIRMNDPDKVMRQGMPVTVRIGLSSS